jgi:hypothetical protein
VCSKPETLENHIIRQTDRSDNEKEKKNYDKRLGEDLSFIRPAQEKVSL